MTWKKEELELPWRSSGWDLPMQGDAGSIPGQGARIPHASGPKNQNTEHKQYCNKFNKDLKKNAPHQKIKIKI